MYRHKPHEHSDSLHSTPQKRASLTPEHTETDDASQTKVDSDDQDKGVSPTPPTQQSFLTATFGFLNNQKPNPLSHPTAHNSSAHTLTSTASSGQLLAQNKSKAPILPPAGKMMVKITYLEELQESLKLANVHTRQAIQRSEMMHTLFRDAAAKIEVGTYNE